MTERIYVTRREQLKKYVAERKNAAKLPRTQIQIATLLGMGDKQFGQLVAEIRKDGKKNKGWRPIKDEAAREFERLLGLPPSWLDGDSEHVLAVSDEPPVSDAVAESRRKNDLLAVRYAMVSLGTVLWKMRPDIATEVARDAVAQAGIPFASQGFLNMFVCTLQGVEQMSAKDLDDLLRQPTSLKPARAI